MATAQVSAPWKGEKMSEPLTVKGAYFTCDCGWVVTAKVTRVTTEDCPNCQNRIKVWPITDAAEGSHAAD